MTTIDITLPDALEQFVAQRAAAGGYANVQEYIVDLLEQIRSSEEGGALETHLQAGVAALDRNEGRPMTPSDWDRLRANVRARHAW
jgi:Arc/MetJ-type ribon-helix-helix transcriptional regulator